MLKFEVINLFGIIHDVVKGQIQIPSRCHPFDWDRWEKLDLLNDIYTEFPIDMLILWKPNFTNEPTRVIIDNERMTQLILILVRLLWPGDAFSETRIDDDPRRGNIWFNTKNASFEHLEIQASHLEPFYFPVRKMMDTVDVLEWEKFIRNEPNPEAEIWIQNMHEVVRIFSTYKLPVITVEDNKYFDKWAKTFFSKNALAVLSDDELLKAKPMSEEEIISALQQGRKDRKAVEACTGTISKFS